MQVYINLTMQHGLHLNSIFTKVSHVQKERPHAGNRLVFCTALDAKLFSETNEKQRMILKKGIKHRKGELVPVAEYTFFLKRGKQDFFRLSLSPWWSVVYLTTPAQKRRDFSECVLGRGLFQLAYLHTNRLPRFRVKRRRNRRGRNKKANVATVKVFSCASECECVPPKDDFRCWGLSF